MTRVQSIKWYAPFAFFILMLLDGQLTRAFETFSKENFFIHSHILLLALVLASFQLSRRYMLVAATVIGALMDSYYLGIIGIYTLCLPLIVYVCYQVFSVLQPNAFTMLLAVILFVTFLETSLLLIQGVFSLANVDAVLFITRTLGPTLLYNLALYLILYIPFKKLFIFK